MPRRFERHARSKSSDWGAPPARSAERSSAAAEPDKRGPARKDTRSWCKGKPGREHVPQIVRVSSSFGQRSCEWIPSYDWRAIRAGTDAWALQWSCWHIESCASCGKILRDLGSIPVSECDSYPGAPGQRAAAERDAAGYLERWRAGTRRHRRPPVTGPQGYRRRR